MGKNNFFGSWNPQTNILPDITNLDFGAWFITETSSFDGTVYKKNEWLVYFCENRGLINETSFWRTTNGIVLFNPQNNFNTHEPGSYTKVRLDNSGNIIDASDIEYEDLPKEITGKIESLDKSIKEISFDLLKNLFYNDVLNPIQLHFDTTTEKIVTELKLDEETLSINKFGQLQAIGQSGNVIQEFDTQEFDKKISFLENEIKLLKPIADNGIKIEHSQAGPIIGVNYDGDSILINPYGQLCINPNIIEEYAKFGSGGNCANHQHDVNDITGLKNYIDNYISNVNITTQLQDNLKQLIDGSTIIINKHGQLTAVAAAVGKHKHLISDITDLNPEIVNTWASNQYLHKNNDNENFNDGAILMGTLTIGEILIAFNQLLNSQKESIKKLLLTENKIQPNEPKNISEVDLFVKNKGKFLYDIIDKKEIECYNESIIEISDIIHYSGFYLKVFIDDVEIEKIKCFSSNDFHFNVGKYGNFNVTYFGEAYPDMKVFQNFYQGFKFEYLVKNVSEGFHIIHFETESTDGKIVKSKKIVLPFYEKIIPEIYITSMNKIEQNFLSGIKRYNGLPDIEVLIKGKCYKKRFSPLNQFRISDSLNEEKIFNSYDFDNGIKYLYKTSCKDFNGKFFVKATIINSDEELSEYKVQYTDYINWDFSTVEKYRVLSDIDYTPNGDGQIITFSKYDSKSILPINECLIKNNCAIVTKDNFEITNIGPNYSNKPDKQSITLMFSVKKKINNFYFDIVNKENSKFEKLRNGTLKNIEIFASFSENNSTQNWLDCNSPWVGYGNANDKFLYPALDLYRSTNIRRFVTLGVRPKMITGFLFFKINFYDSINLELLVKSIEESLSV